jgi:tetratricopeptide (TPR) repeat protein
MHQAKVTYVVRECRKRASVKLGHGLTRMAALSALLLVWFTLLATVPSYAQAQSKLPGKVSYRPDDPLNAQAFDHFYNMEYDRSIQEFDQVLKRHPDDPFAVNHLLVAVLFQELYRIGAMDTSEYANDSFVSKPHRPADENVKKRIRDLIDRAEQLEARQLDVNDKDVDALYARGVTRAEFATYTALIERAWFSALRNAVGARRDHEKVLELNPNYTEAKLIVGAHNYVMGSLSWAVKAAVTMVGLSGSKEKGIAYLQETANYKGETSTDAKIVLMVFLRREKRFDEALQYDRTLISAYPRNLLLALEEGSLLRASGKNSEAATAYKKVWQTGKDGGYPGLHYEAAAVSLGDLLRTQKDYYGAVSAYELISQVAKPDPEISQKANLNAGEVYDLLNKRDQAVVHYQTVITIDGSTPFSETARKRIKDPYRGE